MFQMQLITQFSQSFHSLLQAAQLFAPLAGTATVTLGICVTVALFQSSRQSQVRATDKRVWETALQEVYALRNRAEQAELLGMQQIQWLISLCEFLLPLADSQPEAAELQTLKQGFEAATDGGWQHCQIKNFYHYQAQSLLHRLLEHLHATHALTLSQKYQSMLWVIGSCERLLPATGAQEQELRWLKQTLTTVDVKQLHTVDLSFYEQWAQDILCERLDARSECFPTVLPQGFPLETIQQVLRAAEAQWRETITWEAPTTSGVLLPYLTEQCDRYDDARTLSRVWIEEGQDKQSGESFGKSMKHWANAQALLLILTSPYELKNSDLIEMQFEMFRRNLIQQASYDLKRLAQKHG